LAEPRNFQEVLDRGYVPGRDLRIAFGDANIGRCLLAAPHGGGIEPGTSEILRAIAELGGWAWYEFAGFLRKGNKAGLHIASNRFDEPTLLTLLPQTNFVLSVHGANQRGEAVAYVGGNWVVGRETIAKAMNTSTAAHGIHAVDATTLAPGRLHGAEPANLTNRGKFAQGIQLEFSRAARDLLFPPDCSREARGRRSPRLDALAQSIHAGLESLCQKQ
jgi:phage replication-related protein YjqB (UPF0714/DUF867 family)